MDVGKGNQYTKRVREGDQACIFNLFQNSENTSVYLKVLILIISRRRAAEDRTRKY